jgi:hypothetical protein
MISRRTSSVSKEDVVFPQTALLWFEVLPDLPPALRDLSPSLPGAPRCTQTSHNHSHGTPVAVIRDPSYSEGRPECPPRVRYSPDVDASKFTLHILSDTPGGFQWLKYISLMISCSWVSLKTYCTGCSNTWKLERSRIKLTIDSHRCHDILDSSTSQKHAM